MVGRFIGTGFKATVEIGLGGFDELRCRWATPSSLVALTELQIQRQHIWCEQGAMWMWPSRHGMNSKEEASHLT